MARTLEDVRRAAMELDNEERLRLAEELAVSVQPDEHWISAWAAEADRRYRRLESGEDRGLTLEEFWSDEE
jgi:putative addiction module component (TIGR02574 family)